MGTVTFDTLKFANALKAAGMTPEQAEAQTRALAEAVREIDVATKAVGEIDVATKAVGEIDVATKADLRELEQRLLVRMGAMLAAAVGILIAVLKL